MHVEKFPDRPLDRNSFVFYIPDLVLPYRFSLFSFHSVLLKNTVYIVKLIKSHYLKLNFDNRTLSDDKKGC